MAEDSEGAIWVGTTLGAVVFRSGHPQRLPERHSPQSKGISILCPDPTGGMVIGNSTGVERLRDGTLQPLPLPYPLSQLFLTCLFADPDGALWIGTKAGLFHCRDGQYQLLGEREGLLHPNICFVKPGKDGFLWVGTYGGGLQRFRKSVPTAFTTLGRLGDDRILCLCEDREGSLWVGTRGAGLARLRPGAFRTLGVHEGLGGDLVYPVLEDRRGDLWAGAVGGGLTRFSEGKAFRFKETQGLGDNSVHALFEDRDGSLWAGLDNGFLAHLTGKGFTRYSFQNPALSFKVSAIHRDGAGTLWIGTRGGGIWAKRGERVEVVSPGLPEVDLNIHQFLEARDGTLWAASSTGLWVIRNGRVERPWPQGSPILGLIFCLHEDARGTLWAGTYGDGLLRIKDGAATRASVSQGLAENVIYKILEDSQGAFWISGNRGLSRIPREALDDLLDGRLRRVAPTLFGVAEGLPSSECNGGTHPAGWLLRSGELCFPTAKGLVLFDPRNIRGNPVPPPVVVEEVLVNGREAGAGVGAIPLGRGNVEIRYTALSLANPGKVRFRYMLQGFDRAWVDAGSRRVAFYTNLPPGDYRFRVAACNADGVWNTSGASVRLRLRSPFYRTTWFRFLAMALLIILSWGAYALRERLHRRRSLELEARVAERTAELVSQKERVEELEELYHAIVEDQVELVCRYDPRFSLRFVNRSLAAFSRLPVESLIGTDLYSLLPPALHAQVRAHHASLTPGRPVGSIEIALGTDGPEPRHIEWTTRAFFGDTGEATEYQSVGRDVTRQRRMEKSLLKSQRLEAMGQVAGGVAHDVNNLLQAMRGAAATLRAAKVSDPRLARTAEDLQVDIERCSKLAMQLLFLGPRDTPSSQVLDLNVSLAEMEGLLRRLPPGDIQLLMDLAPEPLPVLVDPGDLEQVLVNLVLNASESMPRGGRILLRTAAEDNQRASLIVSDTGEGIPESIRARIFDPFFTTKGAEGGTGLGLAVVRGVVERHHGTVEVESRPGCGSVFKVILPGATMGNGPPDSLAAPPERSSLDGRRVLVVEDEPDVREWLEEALAMLGCQVTSAGTVAEAEAAARRERPCAVLSDFLLPDGSGADLVRRLRESDPGMAVVLASGYIRESIECGAVPEGVGFLKKPFSLGDLERAMGAALEGVSSRRPGP
jgi:signal transduction histidine kinase/ligand-binding sensor domain-containing protein/CheY-like chemotaxis protein